MKKILYVRGAPYQLNFDSYNLQEVGLGAAFCNKGYDFDILYYSKNNSDQVIDVGNNKLTILWRKGVKILRTGYYPSVLKKDFLAQYDAIITSEYSQIMSVLIAKRHPNVYVYNGPYYNLFKIPFFEKIYDRLFCKTLNKSTKIIFCKTKMAQEFLKKKGMTNTEVVGVGLDIDKYKSEIKPDIETSLLLEKMQGKQNLLYIGSISERKNVKFLINTFIELSKIQEVENIQLVLVGKGQQEYVEQCKSLIPKELQKSIIWCDFIKNAQLKFVYEAASVFLLPSLQEIFGMVLLEAMYFGLPVISSSCAGACTLISDRYNGYLMDNFDDKKWAIKIQELINNELEAKNIGFNASNTIKSDFMWDKIGIKMLKKMIELT